MHAFLLPAILGDEPQLAALRRKLDGRIAFDLLQLPDIDAPVVLLSSLPKTAEAMVEDILRRRPGQSIALVGFSFGASLALEVAAQLTRAGRTVSFLGILDGAFRTIELRRSKAELLQLCKSWTGLASLGRRLFDRLNNRRKLLVATRLASPDGGQSPALREALLTDFRCRALNNWEPPACSAAGLAIFSGALGADNRRRWLELCPNLAVLDAAAEHGDFLKGQSLERIAHALAEISARLEHHGPSALPA